MQRRELTKAALCNAGGTTQLGVDLHAHVGDVLGRGRHDVLSLENLRRYTEANVARLLDAAVDINVAVVDNEEQETRHRVVPIASLIPGLGDCRMLAEFVDVRSRMQLTKFTTVSKIARTHPGLLAVLRMSSEDTTVALVDLHKLLDEGLDSHLRRRVLVLNYADAPGLDRTILVIHGELATTVGR
jgi:hypothetical protein